MGFAGMPPEINSGRLLEGSGSASMARAAGVWDELASTLRATAACYEAVIVGLAAGWPGVMAVAFGRALAPYVAWLNASAAQAAQGATQAGAAVSAYETAVSAIVPLEDVTSNRIRLATLAATNHLAQSGPAIAQVEDEYHRMWVEDAEVMQTYARASAKAAVLTTFSSTVSTIESPDSDGIDVNARRRARRLASAPRVIAAGTQVIGAIPQALQAFSVSGQTTLDINLLPVIPALSTLCSAAGPPDVAIQHLQVMNRRMMLLRAAALSVRQHDNGRQGFGRAHRIGPLSVPARWSTLASDDTIEDNVSVWAWEPLRLVRVNGYTGQSSQ